MVLSLLVINNAHVLLSIKGTCIILVFKQISKEVRYFTTEYPCKEKPRRRSATGIRFLPGICNERRFM